MDDIKFRGYKLSFELHAAHSNIKYSPNDYHFHTFSIVLWLKKSDDDVEAFDDMEKRVKAFLSPYENEFLGKHELFQESDLTVESLGDIFYCELENLLNNDRFTLLRLDIWDSPVRQYSVTKYRMDMNIHPLNISMLLGTSHLKIPKNMTGDFIGEAKNMRDDDSKITIDPSETKVAKEAETAKQEDIGIVESVTMMQDAEADLAQATENADNLSLNVVAGKEETSYTNKKHYQLRMQWQILLACIVLAGAALLLFSCIQGGMISLSGNDTLCHLYRSDYILAQIQRGNLFPLYDASWYNGVEVMRYWGPLPLYLLALIQFIFGGTSLTAYMIFLASLMFISGIGWLRFGIKYHHVTVSVVIGILWFLLPENLRIFVLEGNIPRVVISAILPYLLYSFWMFLHEQKDRSAITIMFLMSLCVLAHLGIAAMVIVTLLLLGSFYATSKHEWKRYFRLIPALALPFLITGLWTVAALHGGGAAKGSGSNQVMAGYFAPFLDSINPLNHWNGSISSFYIGLSIICISLLGIFMGKKKNRPAFLCAFILLACTSKSAYEIFLHLPLSQFLWMIRFVPVALGVAMMGILLWDGLRKWMSLAICIILCLDCASSAMYLYKGFWGQSEAQLLENRDRIAAQVDLPQAKAQTVQRLSIMELSGYGAFAPYYISGVEEKTPYVFGAGWEGAGTATNIVAINSALEFGYYPFVFDRNLELGADTVMIPIAYLANGKSDSELVLAAAKAVGYELVSQSDKSMIFHYPITSTFGVKTSYQHLAIGESAADIATIFPEYEVGASSVIEDYTLEDLSHYQSIYLSKFTYRDKAKAETLLREVSEAGIEVYIDMNAIPTDSKSRKQELFGVVAQSYRFSERYPDLVYNEETYRPALFGSEDAVWNAMTLSGLDDVYGTSTVSDKNITFYGTKENDNLHFIGFNLIYHTLLTRDDTSIALLEDIFDMDHMLLPKRELVPISVQYNEDNIRIDSPEDDVNTTIAFLDVLHSDAMSEKNNLVYVNSGTTIIAIQYPYFNLGLTASISGLVLAAAYLFYLQKKRKMEGGCA